MQEQKTKGYDVHIENGEVYYVDVSRNSKIYMGTLQNLSETTTYLFGDNIPDTVEYVTSGVLPS